MTIMEFHSLPSLSAEYFRALTRLGRPAYSGTLPPLEAVTRGVRIDPDHLAKYNDLCGIPARDKICATYPQVLATPLHGAILASQEFPFPPLGLVHRSNVITRHAPIDRGTPLDLRARLGASREVSRGVEFDLETFADVAGACVWQSTTTVLIRDKKSRAPRNSRTKPAPPPPGDLPGRHRSIIILLAEDLGRRYAKVSGDFNPIHLHGALARPFGFRRAIVQGMWSLARCLGELADDLDEGSLKLRVSFDRPIELPSPVLFSSSVCEESIEFSVKNSDATRTYLSGEILLGI